MNAHIQYFVMDVDGTLTDGKIYIGGNGELMKAFAIKDGLGIHEILPLLGITPVIITGRQSVILENRCKEIGVTELYQGIHDKLSCLRNICYDLSKVLYIGDDLNDLSTMIAVKNEKGLVSCPADAVDEVREIADFICTRNGGDGAVRECIDWLKRGCK